MLKNVYSGLEPFNTLAFQCPRCRSVAHLAENGVSCSQCGTLFPVRNGSLDFMGPYMECPYDDKEVEDIADRVQSVLTIPESARDDVKTAVAASFQRTGVSYIDAEIAALPSRFGMHSPVPVVIDKVKRGTQRSGALTFIRHFAPPVFHKGSTAYVSFRIRADERLDNTGSSSVGLASRWKAVSGWRSLNALFARPNQDVTTLPISVEKGREITVPVRLRIPTVPGEYELTICSVGCNVESRLSLKVQVVDYVETLDVCQGYSNYGQDHLAGIEFLEHYLLGSPPQTLLEVASGVNPHLMTLTGLSHTIIASDVCSNQMQLGRIFSRHHFTEKTQMKLGFTSFDAFNAPFLPGQFHGVAMFSALHHFPDPVAFLVRLASLVRPGGFVAVLCEPCHPGVASVADAYIRDLKAGINEQVFSVEEYRHIFRLAGLQEEKIRDDNGSLKAILRVTSA